MLTKLVILHANDFIAVTAQGTLALEGSKKALADVATAAGPLTDYEILLDTREVKSNLSTADIYELAAELVRLGAAAGHKTAVLCPPERFNDAKFFENCAYNRGLNVRSFTSFEYAMAWLTETPANLLKTTAASA